MRFRDWVKKKLLSKGIILSRPPGQFIIPEIKLADAKRRGLDIRFAIDGGAADGIWARMLRQIWAEARILCIEPRDSTHAELLQTAAELKNIDIAKTLIGNQVGTIDFYEHGDQSSLLPDHEGKLATKTTHPVTTIDHLIAEMKMPWPDLIKLDLQGAELSALQGATQALAHGQAVELEMSFIDFSQNMPLIGDMTAYMKSAGYVLYDVLGLWHRPLDGAMIQGDFLFLKEDHALRKDRRYFGN